MPISVADKASTKTKGSRTLSDALSKTNIKAFCTMAKHKIDVAAHKIAHEVGLKSKKD